MVNFAAHTIHAIKKLKYDGINTTQKNFFLHHKDLSHIRSHT